MRIASRSARVLNARQLIIAVVCSMLLVVTPAQADNLEQDLRDTNRNLVDARSKLNDLSDDVDDAQAALAAIDQRLVGLEQQQRELQSELDAVETKRSDAEAQLELTSRRLNLTRSTLTRVQNDLDEKREKVAGRLSSLYKYGNVSYGEMMLGSTDISALADTTYWVARMVEQDQALVDEVAAVAAELDATRRELDQLEGTLDGQTRLLEGSVAEVERVTTAHDTIVGLVQTQRAERRALLDRLRTEEASYKKLVSELESESRRIAQLLSSSQWSGGAPGSGELVWPTSGRPGSPFGMRVHPIFGTRRMHTGVDIGAPSGQPIVSAAAGKVVSAGWRGGYGRTVVIDHGGGIATLYAHQSSLSVSTGDVVGAGQQIGRVGSTGNSTGPHLHFEVRRNGSPVNPMAWY